MILTPDGVVGVAQLAGGTQLWILQEFVQESGKRSSKQRLHQQSLVR
jgi:hypothetical protein